jgi:ubiquinol-cytochrome c reductase cytochrome c subunit
VRIGLVSLVIAAGAFAFRAHPSLAQSEQRAQGSPLYVASCATCHGTRAQGTGDGPPLIGVGAASLDFMLSTGRMPLNQPNQQPIRQQPAFTGAQIRAIVAYVTAIAPGGPAIPTVDPALGDLARGHELFLSNCAACHGAGAEGDSVGGGEVAPALGQATATQIGEAIRIAPGVMPRFDARTLSTQDVDSIARYLLYLRAQRDPGGLNLGRVGPVMEGFVATVLGLGLLVLVIRYAGTRT